MIILRCRSKPPLIIPTVRDWRKDGKPLLAEDINSNRISTSSGSLLIKSATREDSGNYTCMLVNTAGNVTSNVTEVIVKGELLRRKFFLFLSTGSGKELLGKLYRGLT